MKYYIIDDNPENIRSLRISIEALNHQCFWIDEIGNAKNTGLPSTYIEFTEVVLDNFAENICRYIDKDSVFLIDLALNSEEREVLRYTTENKRKEGLFVLNTAANIIKTLKTNDLSVKIKIMSRIWRPLENCRWKEVLRSISNEPWFESLNFIPTAIIMDAYMYPSVAEFLYSEKSWESVRQ